jgi:transmembrane sensor
MKKSPSLSTRPPTDAAEVALAWATDKGQADDLIRRVQASVKRTRRRRITAASSVAAALLLSVTAWQFWPRDAEHLQVATVTPSSATVLMPTTRVLADGSVVEFKDKAEIAVDFTPAFRRVTLLRGEAHFQVTKNKARPFIVSAGGVEFRAVGTAFAVDLRKNTVELLVTEGRVSVDEAPRGQQLTTSLNNSPDLQTSDSRPPVFVDAGNRVVVDIVTTKATLAAVVPVARLDMTERLSWRVPRLEFNGTPLVQVILMFNEHNHPRLILNPALGSLQMSGTLRADNTDALLLLLKNEFGIEAERRGSGEVYLHR